jgi:hypothetical protein
MAGNKPPGSPSQSLMGPLMVVVPPKAVHPNLLFAPVRCRIHRQLPLTRDVQPLQPPIVLRLARLNENKMSGTSEET